MLLQLAVDLIDNPTVEEAIRVIDEVIDYVDILEIDHVMIAEGPKCLNLFKERYPDKMIYADPKACCFERAELCYENGADCTTLSCWATDNDYKRAMDYAHPQGKLVASDFVGIQNIAERMIQLDRLGVDIISFGPNVCYDLEGLNHDDPTALLVAKQVIRNAKISVMGGVGLDNIEKLAKHKPDIIVAGRGIYAQPNPREVARKMREIMNKYED